MNKIRYAGYAPNAEAGNKYFEVIVPQDAGEIWLLPPFARRESVAAGESAIHILIEQALLPLKDARKICDVEGDGIRHAAAQAAALFNSAYRKKDAVIAALGELIIGYIAMICGEEREFSPVVLIVREDIEKNRSDPTYSLEDALKKLPLNYDYVRKLFKKETGATPHEYLVHTRMKLAAEILSGGISNRYSDYSVSQVAEACGYSEPLYFSRVFKNHYGVAPSEYAAFPKKP